MNEWLVMTSIPFCEFTSFRGSFTDYFLAGKTLLSWRALLLSQEW